MKILGRLLPTWTWPILAALVIGASVLGVKWYAANEVRSALEQKTNKLKADQADAFAKEVKDVAEVSRINRQTAERILVDSRSDAARLREQSTRIVSANCARHGASPDQRGGVASGEGKPSPTGGEAVQAAADAYTDEIAFLWAKLKACGSATGSITDMIERP